MIRKLALVVAILLMVFTAYVVADELSCNGYQSGQSHSCKSPYTMCGQHGSKKFCTSGDDPKFIPTQCDYTGSDGSYCLVLDESTQCNATFSCSWIVDQLNPNGTCKTGEPNASPSWTDIVFDADGNCQKKGGL